jgi:hypothetical protein
MKTYNIYVNPQGAGEAVKQGWSWPGFFFNFIWALIKRIWVLGVVLMILSFALGFAEGTIEVSYGKNAASVISAFTSILNLAQESRIFIMMPSGIRAVYQGLVYRR